MHAKCCCALMMSSSPTDAVERQRMHYSHDRSHAITCYMYYSHTYANTNKSLCIFHNAHKSTNKSHTYAHKQITSMCTNMLHALCMTYTFTNCTLVYAITHTSYVQYVRCLHKNYITQTWTMHCSHAHMQSHTHLHTLFRVQDIDG